MAPMTVLGQNEKRDRAVAGSYLSWESKSPDEIDF